MATAVANADVRPGFALRLPERLPDLKGKWLTFYGVLWAAALLVAVLAPIRGALYDYYWLQHLGWRPHGLLMAQNDQALTVRGVFGEEARRAGVHPGDIVTAVDGSPIGNGSDDAQVNRLVGGPDGSIANLTLRSPGGGDRTVTLTSRASTAAQLFRGTGATRAMFDGAVHFSDLAFLLFLVPPAVLLFVRRRREIVPALLSMALLIIAGFLTGGRVGLVETGVPYPTIDIIAGLLGWIPLALSLTVFPDGRFVPKWTVWALLAFPLFLLNASLWRADWLGNAIAGVSFLVAGVALLLRYRRLPAGPERQQLRWAFFGFFIGISMILVLLPILIAGDRLTAVDPRWMVWSTVFIFPVAALSFPCMALGLMVSVLRYRLYDADTVIGRSAAYGVLTLGFVGLFAGTEKLAELIGERYFEHSIGIVAGAAGAAVAAAVVVPLHNRVHRWAERRFQKPLIRLREGLPECVADLRESAPVEQLVAAVMARVEAGVRSTREAVLLADKRKLVVAGMHGISTKQVRQWQHGWIPAAGEETLDCHRSDPVFPLRVRLSIETGGEPETIGWLLLGPRPDGSFFGKDEREAIEHVAGAVARAIHIAQLREQDRAEIGEMRSRFSRIEDALARLLGGPSKGPMVAS
jgi:hypothetical protein